MHSLEGYKNYQSAVLQFNGAGYDNPMQHRRRSTALYRNPSPSAPLMLKRNRAMSPVDLRSPNMINGGHLSGRMAQMMR